MFIMLDGPDGSGKSTIIETWKKYLTSQGNAIFDLKDYWKKTGHYPELSEIKSYDFIFSSEPTFADMGKVIRNELIKQGTAYPTKAIAEAYSIDRLILYTKILIPLLKEKKCIIQDRGVSTSLAFQTLGKNKLNFTEVTKLSGNDLALKYRPDHLILLKVSAKTIMKRIKSRTDKKDNAIFEKQKFQEMANKQFISPTYKKIFTKHGTKITYLNAETNLAIMNSEATKLLQTILK